MARLFIIINAVLIFLFYDKPVETIYDALTSFGNPFFYTEAGGAAGPSVSQNIHQVTALWELLLLLGDHN